MNSFKYLYSMNDGDFLFSIQIIPECLIVIYHAAV